MSGNRRWRREEGGGERRGRGGGLLRTVGEKGSVNPQILNVRFSYSIVDLPVRFSIFTMGMLSSHPNAQSRRNLLYATTDILVVEG